MSTTVAPGFELRPVVTDEDVERYVTLNQAVTGEGEIARRLIQHRPGARREDFVSAVECATGRVASTTCLLRWRVLFEGVPLDTAMLEMVVTDPAFRKHGLVRAQIDLFHQRAREQGMDLCIIQGIPYYYRQFGYAYALDHTPVVDLPATLVKRGKAHRFRLRPAGPDDMAVLADLYREEMSRQGLSVQRTEQDWRYLLEKSGRSAQIVEGARSGTAAGYASTTARPDRLAVSEAGLRDPADAPALLALLAQPGPGSLEICGNPAHALYAEALSIGGRSRVLGQWLIRIPDTLGLLRKLAPVLEGRLRAASLAGLNASVTLNLFKTAFRITIADGRVAEVKEVGFVDASLGADGGDLCIPPDAFTRLVLGYRNLDQVRDAWPDTTVRAPARPLLEVLFPVASSLVLMPY
jgi:predicted N-acetyltransferase YhbS